MTYNLQTIKNTTMQKKNNEYNKHCCGDCCWFIGEDAYGNGMCAKIFAELTKCEDECHEDKFISREEMRHHLATLMLHNRWRRSNEPTGFYKMQNPKEIGLAIDFAIKYIKTFMKL